MRRMKARITALTTAPDGRPAVRLDPEQAVPWAAGQAFLALRPGDRQPLRQRLFPLDDGQRGLLVALPPEAPWRLGDRLDLLGPLGPGFRPPTAATRWLLVDLVGSPGPLLALVEAGLARGAAISLATPATGLRLPADVERTPDLAEALAWTDYLALLVDPSDPEPLRRLVALTPTERLPSPAEALLDLPLPCGFGGCGACAVRTRHGWRLACREGPVIEADLLEV